MGGQLLAAESINSGRPYTLVDYFGARFHSPFCSLSKAVRPYVRLHGAPLVGLDIANCQPLLVGLVAKSYQRHGDSLRSWSSFEKINGWTGKGRRPDIYKSADGYLDGLVGSIGPEGWEEDKDDLDRYVRLCSEGSWYEEVMEHTGWSRDEAKVEYLRYLYASHKAATTKTVRDLMSDYFPSVDDVVKSIKKKQGTKGFCRVVQRVESCLMLGRVCRELMDQDVPVLTLHDAIYSREQDVTAVESAVRAAFNRVGIRPTIRTEVQHAHQESNSD